jgi:hypothetical protein
VSQSSKSLGKMAGILRSLLDDDAKNTFSAAAIEARMLQVRMNGKQAFVSCVMCVMCVMCNILLINIPFA